MKLGTISKQSYKAIFANKGRSILTILGIVIGIGSVIALIALGNGVKANITKQISTLGTTTLTVTPGAELSQVTSGNTGSNSSSSGPKFGSGGGGGGAGFGDTTST
jgi:putative ABC transport system permease protein